MRPVTIPMADRPVLPDYAGGCLTNVVPDAAGPPSRRGSRLVPVGCARSAAGPAARARRLGLAAARAETVRSCRSWRACRAGRSLRSFPSTTATALTSITTGLPPGEHGVVGYRIDVHGDVLNVLRWSTPRGDARRAIPPEVDAAVRAFPRAPSSRSSRRPSSSARASRRRTCVTRSGAAGACRPR